MSSAATPSAPAASRVFAPVTPAIAAELRRIVGEPHVLYDEPERMADYAHDETSTSQYNRMPEVVVKPDNAQQVSEIVRLAGREHIPVTPRGAGSGLTGGAVPMFGGILLSSERMNRILEIDEENLVAVVEPGVITNDLSEAARARGLFYAAYPMSVEMCCIGGNVAENAGGGRAVKYGVTGRYVLGLEVVLPNGEIVQLGGKRLKDVTGYDMVHLMVGSEGTLGIFTRITLRLLPLPAARRVLLVPFADAESAIGAVPLIMAKGRMMPAAMEFMDAGAVAAAYQSVEERLPPRAGIGAMLLIELDGSAEQVDAEMEKAAAICEEAGALDIYVGASPADEKRMWRPRQRMPEWLTAQDRVQQQEDLVVPPAAVAQLAAEARQLAEQRGFSFVSYGHAGDGNLHIRMAKPADMSEEEWDALIPPLRTDLYRLAARLGGTISGEHGVGLKHLGYLPLVMEPALLALQHAIKLAVDPDGIMNPGKAVP